jgi:tripartite-type tricarboxylate transporter receptor subunit TctC
MRNPKDPQMSATVTAGRPGIAQRFVHLAAFAMALTALSPAAIAQTYPSRPVHLMVGFSPGGGTDITARLIGQWLSEHLGQPFIVENRPGADGSIASDAAARAPADGYTLLLTSFSNATNATLRPDPKHNFMRDITAVAAVMRVPAVMQVNPAMPVTTVAEFIAYAKAHPGKINMASAGNGSPPHLAGELFIMMSGIPMQHVPYRGGGAALAALMGGQAQVTFETTLSSLGFIRSGKLRALAVTTSSRSPVLPDVPSLSEFVPGYEMSTWYGIGAPSGTPMDIVNKLNKEVNAALADPAMGARLSELGAIPLPGSPADFGALIGEETAKWAKVIHTAGIKAD